jgi:hypothetical protein
LQADQLLRERSYPIDVTSAPTKVHPKVASFRPAETAQALCQSHDAGLRLRIILGEARQHAKPPYPLARLRARRQRPCRRDAEERE